MKTMTMMKNKIFLMILIFISTVAHASELTDTANKDWLELVRKYTSEDLTINFEEAENDYKWEKLINGSKRSGSFLSEWWQAIGDDVLTELINDAFLNNRDFMAARAKVLEARAQLGISRADLNPKFNFSSIYENGRNSDVEDEDIKSFNKYLIGFDSSWEIDLFGKKQNLLKAAKENLEAENSNLDDVWVSLSAETALNYFELRILQKRLEIAKNNLNTQSEFLEILKSQHKSGLIDEYAVQKAYSELEITRSNIPEISQAINERMNVLAILTGEIPGSLNSKLSKVKDFPNLNIEKLIGIPAETLRQRPDIRAAEKNLEAQIQKRKAAEKSYYPVIELTGSIGLESFSTGHLFSSGSYTYSITPAIKWPIFSTGEIRKNILVQTAVEKQLLSEFESVILKAIGEVHDALNANAQEILRSESLESALKLAISNLEINKDKYIQGLINFSEVLKCRQEVYSIENGFISSEGKKFINLIALFKSLGGGWKLIAE